VLDSGAFRDFPGLLNYTVIIGQSVTKVKGMCLYVNINY